MKTTNAEIKMNALVDRLRTERLERGWTLKDVSDRSRMSITVLKRLEQGAFEELGAPFVIDALLRSYAGVLGIDPEVQEPESGTHRSDEEPFVAARKQAGSAGRIIKLAVAAVVLCALLAGAWQAAFFINVKRPAVVLDSHQDTNLSGNNETAPPPTINESAREGEASDLAKSPGDQGSNHDELPSPPEHVSVSIENSSAQSEQLPVLQTSPGPGVAANPSPSRDTPVHYLEIQADQKTWVQVTVDGSKSDSELLEPGELRKWKAANQVNLVVGNGGGVRIRWDGKRVEMTGKPGRVTRLKFPDAALPGDS